MSKFLGCLAILPLAALGVAYDAVAEVYAEPTPDGGAIEVRVVPTQSQRGQIWEPVGAADDPDYVLNPDGDRRGDGRPHIAVNPSDGMPHAVWAMRQAGRRVIVASAFNGRNWSLPAQVHPSDDADNVDPRIAFRSDGTAIVVWWRKGTLPVVRMAHAAPGQAWVQAGVISEAGVKAKKPAVRQEGSLTIVAYLTPRGVEIATFTLASSGFADGPTPFPRSGDGDSSKRPPDLTP